MPDTADALLGRIQSGADGSLDCREVVFAGNRIEEPGRDELADEMAAFANAKGGVLVLGVSRGTRGVVGIPLDALDAVMQHVVGGVLRPTVTGLLSIRGFKVRLRMFSDRIELYSPGALPDSMTVDDLPRKRTARNPAVANLLARCSVPEGIESVGATLMERRAGGVPAILDRSQRLSGRQPVYEAFGRELRLTIYAAEPGAEGAAR